jgi:hypothetical protein
MNSSIKIAISNIVGCYAHLACFMKTDSVKKMPTEKANHFRKGGTQSRWPKFSGSKELEDRAAGPPTAINLEGY